MLGFEAQDASTFASWGLSFLKVDSCAGHDDSPAQQWLNFGVIRDVSLRICFCLSYSRVLLTHYHLAGPQCYRCSHISVHLPYNSHTCWATTALPRMGRCLYARSLGSEYRELGRPNTC